MQSICEPLVDDTLHDRNLGYKRDDPTTIRQEYLPAISEKGSKFQGYGMFRAVA